MVKLIHGDCLKIMDKMKPNCIDSIVTDPPAGISFMGKKWDHDKGGRKQWIAWMQEVAIECLRVLKPGGHALVWSIPRTSHWTATAWENAGFEIRDCVYHIFGSGFPKSHNLSKAMDRMAGVKRKVIGVNPNSVGRTTNKTGGRLIGGHKEDRASVDILTAPTSPEAQQWNGWGTALKPAVECWWLLRKPLSEKTIAANVLKWSTGGLNIDGCRVPTDPNQDDMLRKVERKPRETILWEKGSGFKNETNSLTGVRSDGRFPAHLIHDGSEEVLEQFPNSKGQQGDLLNHKKKRKSPNGCFGEMAPAKDCLKRNDSGSAARFFYCAKASKKDRNEGCEELDQQQTWASQEKREANSFDVFESDGRPKTVNKNNHPTIKPTELMKYLCRLITPPEGIIFDPFMGSGSTGKAAILEDFHFIGIEMERDYITIAKKRIAHAKKEKDHGNS
jgi:site-specific DNA-methyltransferase (adenine-specific)